MQEESIFFRKLQYFLLCEHKKSAPLDALYLLCLRFFTLSEPAIPFNVWNGTVMLIY